MDAIALVREQYKGAHDLLETVMKDVTPEQAHWAPPGSAHPIGPSYFHAITAEDVMLRAIAAGGAPLIATTFADKAGVSKPYPTPGTPWDGWARSVTCDLEKMRAYAQAIYASTDEYLASLSPADLDRPIDLSFFGLGQQPLSTLIAGMALQHLNNHLGEISCLKGLQGAKGYPF